LNDYPVGLYAKTLFFRVLKSVFTQECQEFILSRMKASSRNIKPVIVIDDKSLECIAFIPNTDLTKLEVDDSLQSRILCMKVKPTGEFYVEKYKIQMSNLSPDKKEQKIKKLLPMRLG
jgi:hypothetical protein